MISRPLFVGILIVVFSTLGYLVYRVNQPAAPIILKTQSLFKKRHFNVTYQIDGGGQGMKWVTTTDGKYFSFYQLEETVGKPIVILFVQELSEEDMNKFWSK